MEAMTRRRLVCGLLLASAVLACFAGWLWMVSRPRVTRERFEQVKEGMSREEVIRTVGGPPRGRFKAFDLDLWFCDDAHLHVRFDDADSATFVEVFDTIDIRP